MSAGAGPPRPRLVVRVGVSGHRELGPKERITAQVKQVLEAIRRTVQHIIAADESETQKRVAAGAEQAVPAYDRRDGIEVRVVTGLAEGADRLVVDVVRAMAPGPVRFSYAAILPFPAADYETDFCNKPESVMEFRRLLKGAQAVLAFDDKRAQERRAYGYIALRDALVQHCDVLIAIWDGEPGRGQGGTEDVMTRALRAGIPVVWIHAAREQEPGLAVLPSPDEPDILPRRKPPKAEHGGTLSSELRDALRASVAPPEFPEPEGGYAGYYEKRRRQGANLPEPGGRERIDAFYAEPASAALPRRAYRVFYEWFGGRRPSYDVHAGGASVGLPDRMKALKARALAAWVAFRKRERAPDPIAKAAAGGWQEIDPLLASAPGSLDRFRDILLWRHVWADQLAVRYADAYRSSYVTILPLGALAVLAGLLALLIKNDDWSTQAKSVALFVEGAILLGAGWFCYRRPRKQFWHRRFVEYRAVAELLRHQRYVYALGGAERLERENDEITGREPDAWVGWYVRATIREIGFPSLTVTADHARNVLASFRTVELGDRRHGQIAYNHDRHEKLHRLDAVLGARVRQLWLLIMVLAFGGSLLFLAIWGRKLYDHHWYEQHAADIQTVKALFTIALALLPAIASAIHGLRAQGEFESFAKRTETTGRELDEMSSEIGRALQEPWTGRRRAALFIRQANDVMASDLAGWSAVYRHHAAEPPG